MWQGLYPHLGMEQEHMWGAVGSLWGHAKNKCGAWQGPCGDVVGVPVGTLQSLCGDVWESPWGFDSLGT